MRICSILRVITLFLITNYTFTFSQVENNFTYGFCAGVNYTDIKEIKEMFINEVFYSGYETSNKKFVSPQAGFFVNYKFPETKMAIHTQLYYSNERVRFEYNDIKDLEYSTDFKFQFIQFQILAKLYPYKGINIGIGPQLGFNLLPNNIYYKSNQEQLYGSDLQTQLYIRNHIRGRSNFQLVSSLGYEFTFGLWMDLRYNFGVSDILETNANDFRWVETNNFSNSFQFTIGYMFKHEREKNYF